jgi:mannose-6-phosphate isomerase-like protein (cupin superfamily)
MPDDKKTPDYSTKTVRPWGHFRHLDQGPGFVAKAILVKGEQRLSLQRHQHRAETWTVAMGVAIATVNGVKHALSAGESIRIPLGATHRLTNPAKEPLVIIEVWIGADLREDDIERLEDDYGREKPFLTGGVITGAPSALIGIDNPEVVIPLGDGRIDISLREKK